MDIAVLVVRHAADFPRYISPGIQRPVGTENSWYYIRNVAVGGIFKAYGKFEVRILVSVERDGQAEGSGVKGWIHLSILYEVPGFGRRAFRLIAHAHLSPRWLRQRKCQHRNG